MSDKLQKSPLAVVFNIVLAVALVLFALLLVLGVTSFNFVKKRMRKEAL